MAWCIWIYWTYVVSRLVVVCCIARKTKNPKRCFALIFGTLIFCQALLYFGGAFHAIGLN